MGFAQASGESTEFCRVPKSVDELCATPTGIREDPHLFCRPEHTGPTWQPTGIRDGDAKLLENPNGFIESLPVLYAPGWCNRRLLCHVVTSPLWFVAVSDICRTFLVVAIVLSASAIVTIVEIYLLPEALG